MQISTLLFAFVMAYLAYLFISQGADFKSQKNILIAGAIFTAVYVISLIIQYLHDGKIESRTFWALILVIPFVYGAVQKNMGKGNKRPQSLYIDEDKLILFVPGTKVNASRSLLGGYDFATEDHEYAYDTNTVQITKANGIITITGSGMETFLECSNMANEGKPIHRDKFENLSLSLHEEELEIDENIRKRFDL